MISSCTGWDLHATLALSFIKQTDVPPVAAMLPPGLTPVIVPSSTKVWSNATNVVVYFSRYDASPVGSYSSLIVAATAHHAASNTSGYYALASYSDSSNATTCGKETWGLPTEQATFSWTNGKVPYDYDAVTVQSTSSLFGKNIASFTNYYNTSITPTPAFNGTCTSPFDASNCTKRHDHLQVRNRSLLTWGLQTTGLVQPSFGKFSVDGSVAWSSLGLDTKSGPVPSQLATRQENARGNRSAPALVCSNCLP